ncbi:MAG TPA: hypothetical protein VE645_08405 [Pseudonocardiaceae bacterium]|nr:hypothetical protein [Pseudonocardiaceae bacterium]
MVDPVQDETYGTELDAFVSEDRTQPAAADGEGLELLAERFEEDVAGTGEAAPEGDELGGERENEGRGGCAAIVDRLHPADGD